MVIERKQILKIVGFKSYIELVPIVLLDIAQCYIYFYIFVGHLGINICIIYMCNSNFNYKV